MLHRDIILSNSLGPRWNPTSCGGKDINVHADGGLGGVLIPHLFSRQINEALLAVHPK